MHTTNIPRGLQTLGTADLAKILHKSPVTIQADANRNPGLLPPRLRIPGSSRLLWRKDTVLRWLKSNEDAQPRISRGNTK